MSIKKPKGHWPLVDIKGNVTELNTRMLAEVYKHKESGKEYTRGKMIVYFDGRKVDLIEDNPDEWSLFIKTAKRGSSVSMLEEIYIGQLLK